MSVYQLKYMDSVPESAVCNEAFKLEKGQVSNVYETPFGYEIVKVTNKKTEQKSLEDSREEIVNRILADKYLDQVNSLREKSDVQRF